MLDRREVFEIEYFDWKMTHRFDKNQENRRSQISTHWKDLRNECPTIYVDKNIL